MGYSMQSNKKIIEGKQHPDRDEQFHFINRKVKNFQGQGYPVISVDAKKKENIGLFKNSGTEWEKHGQPVKVNTYDFPDKEKGKACPYGVYDMTRNEGWANVGNKVAIQLNLLWRVFVVGGKGDMEIPSSNKPTDNSGWRRMAADGGGWRRMAADGGGSNGHRTRLWNREIQALSNELNLTIQVCHFPPGTNKWNKIENQMFSFISKNWRGKPLDSIGTIVNLIANITTQNGLQNRAEIDKSEYEKGIKISDEEMASLNIHRENFHGEWNYKISPF